MTKENNHTTEFEVTDVTFLKDILRLQLLPYSTYTSIKKFCKKHHTPIFGRGRKYVFTVQFMRACLEARINDLKREYGKNWYEVLQSDMNLYAKYKSTLETIKGEKEVIPAPIEITRKGKNDIEKRFLLDIDNALEVASSPQ